MNFLIVKLSALGDVVQALPVAMAIKSQMPGARVDWLAERPSAPLLDGHPALDRVLVSPRHEVSWAQGKVLGPASKFIKDLRSISYDVVLDLQGLMKSAMLVALSRGACKVGFKGGKEPLAALALSEKLPPYDPDKHAVERYLDILEPLGLMRPARPEFGLKPEARTLDAARELLGAGLGRRPLVVLHPVAKWDSKLWPVDNWAELAAGLAESGFYVAITGSADDKGTAKAIVAGAGHEGRFIDLAGKTGLKALAAVLTLAECAVTTDTGVMHLAAAVNCPVTALFGPTAPWRTGPYGKGHRVVRLGLDCSPCFRRTCENPWCMNEISTQSVLRAVDEHMAGS